MPFLSGIRDGERPLLIANELEFQLPIHPIVIFHKTLKLKKDEKVYIPVKEKHRMSNFTNENVVFIEVQNGDYLGEDDIIRYEDIYGRK